MGEIFFPPKKLEMQKICRLVNDTFNWALYVDGEEIRFTGMHNANYFAKHYEDLGYKIEWDKEKYKRIYKFIHKSTGFPKS